MVSIVKNQLLKHLSRYTKNLSPDKVNLSTFRGEGELSNLQLDENVLTELLELPTWLRLTSAWCNHVLFRISWTKLKSVPITLTLDEVNITIETCETRTAGTPTAGLSAPQGKYSFIHKIVDGITIIVNRVNVNFKSPAFTACVEMSRIRVESRTPKWLPGDLRLTRLKDPARGLILIFKELSWQTVRIEASSTQDQNLTPLRLLTNQARCRITIKKKLSDCSVLSSRLVLILDDLLWVLTDSQLKAALHFVDSLTGLIQTSTSAIQRTKAQKKLERLPEYQAQLAQSARPNENVQISAAQKSFNIFDVKETSYHFFSQRIDLHLCDDAGDGRSSYPSLKDGGALQISVQGFQVDFYPYHLAKADRAHWPKYKETTVPPALWLEQSLNAFKESLLNLSNPNRPSAHAPLERTTPNQQQPQTPQQQSQQTSQTNNPSNLPQSTPGTPSQSSPMKHIVLNNLDKLMTSCVILRIEDFTLYRVTTSGKKQMPKEFIAGDKDRFSFPPEMPILHAEFTYFYYPGDFVFPLPPSKAYIHINPVQLTFDLDSCLWFSSFALNLHESLLRTSVANTMNSQLNSPNLSTATEPSLMYMDVKLESIMPRIIIESAVDAPQQRDRPKSMQIQVSRFAITNIREMGASRADLAQAIHSLQEGSLVFSSGFPSKSGDLCIVTDRILSHVAATDVTLTQPNSPTSASSASNLTRHALWSEPRDIWCIKLDPIWIDFYGARSIGPNRPIPFIDAVPITLWVHGKTLNMPDVLNEKMKTFEMELNSTVKKDLILSVNNLQQSLDINSDKTNLLNNHTPNNNQYLYDTTRYYIDDINNVNKQHNHLSNHDNQSNRVLDSQTNSNINNNNNNNNVNVDETTGDLHVIAHVSNLVSVQIDHYQYLFLLRLAEEFTELATFLSLDSKRILKENNLDKSIIIGCVVPQIEVSLIMPSQTPGKESSGGDGESVIPDSASLGDDLQTNGSVWQLPSSLPLDQAKNLNAFGSIETASPITHDGPSDITFTSVPNAHGHNVQIQNVASTSSITRQANFDTGNPPATPSMKSRNRNSIIDNTIISKELNSGFSSMKKGLTSFMTSIDSALKTGTINDDMSDTISVQSDMSSDSENYVMILGDSEKTADCMDVMFKLNPFNTDSNTMKVAPVEVASEVCEDPFLTNMSSPSEPSEASSLKRRDLVSMVTFRLTTVEFIKQNKGSDSSIRVQVSAISCDECGAIPWDEFQTKFGARCRAWNMAPFNPEAPPIIAVRLDEIVNIPSDISQILDKKTVLEWFTRKLEIHVKDLSLQMSMSTAIGLGDLTEDEIIVAPIPTELELENINLNLIDDRPPVNITSPGPIPINLSIGKMKVFRDLAGIVHIQPEASETKSNNLRSHPPLMNKTERDRELISMQLIMQQLKMDNDTLKRQLLSTEKSNDSHRMKQRQDNETLKSYLKAAEEEKRALMDTIMSLQQQLSSANDGKR